MMCFSGSKYQTIPVQAFVCHLPERCNFDKLIEDHQSLCLIDIGHPI